MNGKTIKSILIGALFGLMTAILLILVLTAVSIKGDDPDKFITLFSHLARFSGALAAGFLSARLNGEGGILCGSLSGVLYSLVILFVSCFGDSNSFGTSLLLSLISILLSSLFGFLGLPKEKSTAKKRKEMMRRFS